MATLVRVQNKGQMTIPSRVRSAVGLSDGDIVEVKAVGRKIVITPQLVIDRSQFPTADEYTPEQRRAIEQLAAAPLPVQKAFIKQIKLPGPELETSVPTRQEIRRGCGPLAGSG